MLENIFVEISVILLLAIVVAGIMKYLKQPLIISYILTGILAGPYFFNLARSTEAIEVFAEIGVAILLFLVGIHLNPKIIKEVGRISLITGLGQVFITSIIGFTIVMLVGFSIIESLYIAIALTFSSTIIIMKLLSDKGDLDTLYGKISMGFLIVQDFVAMILLMFISAGAGGGTLAEILTTIILIGGGLIILFLMFGYYILPHIMKKIAKSQEFILLFSIAWCLIAASIFYMFNFSIEVGALLAGITLSISPYRHYISAVLKPLRDFFIFMFFIFLGTQMVFEGLTDFVIPIIILSLFILIGNLAIVLFLLTKLGYSSRTGFLSGLTVAQISEFSLILVSLGVSVGDLSQEVLSFVTIIGVITISVSTYMILYAEKLYPYIKRYISRLEKSNAIDETKIEGEHDVILIGAHRMARHIIPALKEEKRDFIVIDHDPKKIEAIENEGFKAIYGDISDDEFLNNIAITNTKKVISTMPDQELSLNLVRKIKRESPATVVIPSARYTDDALELYEEGADYVIMPYYLGGEHLAYLEKTLGLKKSKYEEKRINHIIQLKRNNYGSVEDYKK